MKKLRNERITCTGQLLASKFSISVNHALERGRYYKVRLLVINSYCTLEVLVLILQRVCGIEAHGEGRRDGGGGGEGGKVVIFAQLTGQTLQ